MLSKFSTSAKLYLLIFITAASLIGLGLYGIDDLREMNENTRTLYADRVLCMQQLANMRFEYMTYIQPMARKVKDHELTFIEAKKQVQTAREIINTNWHYYKLSYLTPEEQLLVAQMDVIKNQADKTNENLESILSKEDTHALDDLIQKESSTGLPPFIIKVTQLMELQVRVGKEIFNNSKEIYQRTSRNFFLLILFSLLIALSLSFYIIKNIKSLIKDILNSNNIIKKSEEKYRKANARFKAIVENVFVGIKLNDSNWQIIYRSPSMEAINGWADEKMNQDYFNLIHPDDLEMIKKVHGEVLLNPGKTINIIYRILHKNGHYIWIESQLCNKLSDPDLGAIITVIRDITERKQMEAEIREAEIKFRTLAEKSMVGIYIIQEEKFLYLNPRFAEIFGYQQHELTNTQGSIIDIIISEEDKARVRNNIQSRYEGKVDNVHYEFKGKKKDGTVNYVEILGSSVIINGVPSIIGSMIDITDRKRDEDILKRSEANLKTIMDTTDTAYALLDKKLNVMAFNQKATEFVNSQFKHFPAKGDQLADYFPKERFPQFSKYAVEVLKGKNISYEANYPQADGSVFWYYVRLFPIKNEKNEIFGLMMALSDITERKKSEESLKIAYSRIQNQVNSIKVMAWKQSHLIRSPLANLMGLTTILMDDPSDSDILVFIQNELNRMDTIIIEMAEDAADHVM